MARDQIRPAAGALVFPAGGGVELPMEIPKNAAYKALLIRFSDSFTLGGGSGATATASILELVQNIRLIADGKLNLCNCDGFALRELNRIWYGSVPPEDTFVAVGAPTTYTANLILPIAPPFLYDDAVGLLPAVPLTGLVLSFNIGTTANLLTTPSASTHTMTITVETWEILDLAAQLAVSPMVISQSAHAVVTGNGNRHPLKRGNRLAGVLMSARSTAATGNSQIFQAGIIQRLGLEINVPNTGVQTLRNTGYNENRAFNRIYGSGKFGGQATDLAAGMMYFNFHGDAQKSSPLDVSGATDVFLTLDETTVGTNPRVVVTEAEIIPRPV